MSAYLKTLRCLLFMQHVHVHDKIKGTAFCNRFNYKGSNAEKQCTQSCVTVLLPQLHIKDLICRI